MMALEQKKKKLDQIHKNCVCFQRRICPRRLREVIKLDLLKRSRFPLKNISRDFYFKVILSSLKYETGLWGARCNWDLFHSIERLHCRASRTIFNLPKDMAPCEALRYDQWPSLFLYYKLDIFSLFYKGHNNSLPELLSKNIYTKRCNGYSLRGKHCLLVPRINKGRASVKSINSKEHCLF